jgi:hypothetical protein
MTLEQAQTYAMGRLDAGDQRDAVLVMCRWADDVAISELGMQVLMTGDAGVIKEFIEGFLE